MCPQKLKQIRARETDRPRAEGGRKKVLRSRTISMNILELF